MLQIASGKLFTRRIERRNELRGVLYTNLSFPRELTIETAAGRLLSTSVPQESQAIVYEYTEAIEEEVKGPGILLSHGMQPYLNDFGAIVSFVLQVTCTPDADFVGRLTSGRAGLSVGVPPGKLIKRVFDSRIWFQDGDVAQLVTLVRVLMGLPRKSFLGVMRAVRTYVTALHRLGDDAELSYTLLVASMESMAQSFDGHRAEWRDFDEDKRNAVDDALTGAPDGVTARVRDVLIGFEHTSLSRRFRDFALAHVNPAFFRAEADGQEHPVGRSELPAALNQAYRLRSRYVHSLDELPRILTLGHSYAETTRIGQSTILTFQGLARLARHVIISFMVRQPQIEVEPYDYQLERSNVVQVQMAAEYWIWQTEGLTAAHGKSRLEGFFEQVSPILDGVSDAKLTDIRPLLATLEPMLPEMRATERLPFLALYFLFNWFASDEQRTPNLQKIWKRFGAELQAPTVESLLLHLVQLKMPHWTMADHHALHDDYFRRRERKNGLRVTRTLEMRLTLMLAERHRAAGDYHAARSLVAFAVENRPGDRSLQELETNFAPERPIDWQDELTRRGSNDAIVQATS